LQGSGSGFLSLNELGLHDTVLGQMLRISGQAVSISSKIASFLQSGWEHVVLGRE
jgi:hypothetical protein